MPRIYIVVLLLPNMCCGDREKNVRTVCLLTNLATAKTLGDDVKTPRLTAVCKLETNVTLWQSVVEARVYLIIYVTDVIFLGGITSLFSVQHESVDAAEALLQTASPFQPDGSPHV